MEMSSKTAQYHICEAPGCINTFISSNNPSTENKPFFRFPLQDKEKCLQWVEFANLKHTWKGSTLMYKNHYLCADHFESNCFTNAQRQKLNQHAVPTICKLNPDLQDTPDKTGHSAEATVSKDKLNGNHENSQKKFVHPESRDVQKCAAPDCENFPCKASTLLFHRFPFHNPTLLKLWTKSLSQEEENWTPKRYDIICSNHFNSSDYTKDANGIKYLKDTAVPKVQASDSHKAAGSNEVIYIIGDSEDFDTQLKNILRKDTGENKEPCMPVDHNYSLPTSETQKNANSTLLLYTNPAIKEHSSKYTQTAVIEMPKLAPNSSSSVSQLKREIRLLQRKVYRRDMKIKNMYQLVKHLKARHT